MSKIHKPWLTREDLNLFLGGGGGIFDVSPHAASHEVGGIDLIAFADITDFGDWLDQAVKQASSPIFVTAKLSALTDGYIPYHVDDATGLADSPITVVADGIRIIEPGAADYMDLLLDGTDAFFKWSDGSLNLQTTEADTNSEVHIHGNGTGVGILRIFNATDTEYLSLYQLGGVGYIATTGGAPGQILLQATVAQDIFCWLAIGAGNPNLRIYGWNTASAAVRYTNLSMDDVNDEFLIEAENHADHEGITINLLETNQRFRVRQNADYMAMYLTATDAFFTWSDGSLNLQTDETDTITEVHIHGQGTGYGSLRAYDEDDAEYLNIYAGGGYGHLRVQGAAPAGLSLQYGEHQDIFCWLGITEGNPYFYLYGWHATDTDWMRMRVEADGDALIEAENDLNLRAGGGDINLGDENLTTTGIMKAQTFHLSAGVTPNLAWLSDVTLGTLEEGETIRYDQATAKFIDSWGIDYDNPRLVYKIYTEFFQIGDSLNDPWLGATIIDGTSTTRDSTKNHPGIMRLSSSGNAQSGYSFLTAINSFMLGGAEHSEFCFKTGINLNDVRVRLGYQDSINDAAPTDGTWIDMNDGTLTGKTRKAGALSTTGTNYALAATTWYRGKIAVLANQLLTLLVAGYVNCVAGDVGKQVQVAGVEFGLLDSYNNVTHIWRVSTGRLIPTGSAITITGGTGEGTADGNSVTTIKEIEFSVYTDVAGEQTIVWTDTLATNIPIAVTGHGVVAWIDAASGQALIDLDMMIATRAGYITR